MDKVIQASDERTISFADFGEDNQITAFYCHGGLGSRNAAKGNADKDTENLIRYVGVDRPEYGNTSPFFWRSFEQTLDRGSYRFKSCIIHQLNQYPLGFRLIAH